MSRKALSVAVVLPALLLIVLVSSGCRRQEPDQASVPHFKPPQTKPDARLITAQERFACKLLAALHEEQPTGNLFFSPTSLSLALAMLCNGAKGDTLDAVMKTAEFQDLSVADLNGGYQTLTEGLDLGKDEPTVSIANALWVDSGWPAVPSFLQVMDRSYGAPPRSIEFGNTSAAAREINRWAEDETEGMIPGIVSPEDLDGVVLLLANALYFEGKWHDPFKESHTQPMAFHLLDGGQKQVPLMSQQGEYLYLERPEFQAISLPYASGRLSFHVFLPAETTKLDDFVATVTPENWSAWLQQFVEREGAIKLPRFKAEYGEHLKKLLTRLGMGVAFDPEKADLTGMVEPGGVWVGDVIHRAIVEVNEKGTRAAAVTAIPVEGGIRPAPLSAFSMVVDRPFLCAIRDNATGAILFMGVVVDPEELRG